MVFFDDVPLLAASEGEETPLLTLDDSCPCEDGLEWREGDDEDVDCALGGESDEMPFELYPVSNGGGFKLSRNLREIRSKNATSDGEEEEEDDADAKDVGIPRPDRTSFR